MMMKKILLLILMSFMTLLTANAQNDIVLSCPDDNHPHAIDLGLPSGTKWACCNVGAQKPFERGGYYAWGETEEKDSYELNTYKFFTTTGYQNIGGDIAGTEYDVAHVKWGEGWQMPSFDRVKELVRGCTCSWTTMNGVIGEKFTSKYNGAIIFIPANGFCSGTNVISLDENGCYWSGTSVTAPLGCTLTFGNEEADFLWFIDRWYGMPVRPTTGGTDVMPLLLSADSLILSTDQKARVTITSGSDHYSVVSSNPDVASARAIDMIVYIEVEIKAYHLGETTITVKDEKSGQSVDIHVLVDDTYFPEGTTWEEERHCYYEREQRYQSQYYRNTVEGDTIINGITYKNVLLEMRTCDEQQYDEFGYPLYGWDRESPWHWMSLGHYYGIREEGNKVYCYGDFFWGYYGQNPQEVLAYDFDWYVGKEIPVYFNSNGKMVNDTITEIGQLEMLDRNAYECIYQPGGNDLLQVNGIGNLGNNGGLFRHLTDFPWDGSTLRYKRVMNFTRNGRLLYQWDRDAFLEEMLGVEPSAQDDYRTMVKDGKVWKVGFHDSGNPVQHVEYFYFDGDTIIDGKACKQMMSQQYYGPDASDDAYTSQLSPLSYVGAWYEEDKKVYTYDTTSKQFRLMYDFSVDANDTLVINQEDYYLIGPRQTGGLRGFKGVYRDVWLLTEEGPIFSPSWLEGVGSIDGPTTNVYSGYVDPLRFLMSCTVDDEVIYFNDEFEDGATPEELNANKHRFDFTHTVKTKPKVPGMGGEERQKGVASADMQSLYGEYSQQLLSIRLDPLEETYVVCIKNESNEIVYEKTVNTVDIVGLNIDISTYAKGRYTATVENGNESFVGEFEVQTTGIETITNKKEDAKTYIYNLQGQRIRFLQKGLNIVNGRKVYVK